MYGLQGHNEIWIILRKYSKLHEELGMKTHIVYQTVTDLKVKGYVGVWNAFIAWKTILILRHIF